MLEINLMGYVFIQVIKLRDDRFALRFSPECIATPALACVRIRKLNIISSKCIHSLNEYGMSRDYLYVLMHLHAQRCIVSLLSLSLSLSIDLSLNSVSLSLSIPFTMHKRLFLVLIMFIIIILNH